ncbi:MAG TPA: phytoene/squalene synthase family protein [Mycobacteriales bacterium]|jgi:phytoene synthase|nr:phytoene/squalene synthase family protein [Mycobacteriales bacterium]
MNHWRALDAAGITDPALRASYRACRAVNATHGRTFYLSTYLLPRGKRPAVHALYGFARRADEIVDAIEPARSVAERDRDLTHWTELLLRGAGDDPVMPAVHDTIVRNNIPLHLFDDFLASMRKDLTTSDYATWDDLVDYMQGSAATIGSQLVPVLGTVPGAMEEAEPYARTLGLAFQLTNFIRDVGEDLGRGRVYLPKEDLTAFGVTSDDLYAGKVNANIKALLAFEISRAHELYRSAEPGIDLLDPASRDCVRTAFRLYRGILDAVERSGYRVLDRRASVSMPRRLAVALPAAARARRTR